MYNNIAMDLKDKIALVTGGSSGMGQAISIALAEEGCKVFITYNSNENGADETLRLTGENCFKVKVDLHSEAEMQNLFDLIKEKFGKLDILVNNAGVNRPRGLFETSDWKEVFQVDLYAPVFCSGKAVELMGGKGKILNITSIYGEPKACFKGIGPYGPAKAALNHFTLMLAKNLAPEILVNAIAPGYVKTSLWKDTTEADFADAGKEQLIDRMIMPEEIAQMAMAVIKNDAMTGEIVVVDGGISLRTI